MNRLIKTFKKISLKSYDLCLAKVFIRKNSKKYQTLLKLFIFTAAFLGMSHLAFFDPLAPLFCFLACFFCWGGAWFEKCFPIRRRHVLLKKKAHQQAVQLATLRGILKSKNEQEKKIRVLFSEIQKRYRRISAHILGYNRLMAKLFSQEKGVTSTSPKIFSLLEQSETLLANLSRGNLMMDGEELSDFMDCFAKVYRQFLPEILERKLLIKIKGRLKSPLLLDRLMIEIVLHNLFEKTMNDSLNKGRVHIEIQNTRPVQIMFSNNGWDLEDTLCDIQPARIKEDLLHMSKKRLQAFASFSGWCISFPEAKRPFHNAILLSIPYGEAIQQPTNVISLSDFQKTPENSL